MTPQPISIIQIPDTDYIVLAEDQNFVPAALEKGTILLEESIANLSIVQSLGLRDEIADVGGLYGDTALIFAKNGARVHVFEPQKDAYFCLLWNTQNKPNIKPYNRAVGNGSRLKPNQDALGGNMGTRTTLPSEDGEPSLRLDDIEFENLKLLKADVEGHEFHVLEGACKTIEKHQPAILLEIYPEMLRKADRTPEDIYELLHKLGYEWQVVIGNDSEPRFDILATPISKNC